jgi:hypothetical protein
MEADVSTLRNALAVTIVTLGLSGAIAAPAHGAGSICVPVHAQGVGQDLGNGNTTATITTHGLLLGTTNASFVITGVSGTTASFAGPIVFTTPIGTLTAQTVGTFDVVSGAFRSTSTSLTGTGLFRRVSGHVTLAGVQDLATGRFTETITGRLCL